jgi:hypothetical protein
MVKLFLILISFLPAMAADLIPVKWRTTNSVFKDLKSLSEFPDLMKKNLEPVGLVKENPDKKTFDEKIANNCPQYLEYKSQGYEPNTNADIAMEGFFKLSCDPIQWLSQAKPSKKSFVKNYSFSKKSLKELPPSLGGLGGDSSYKEKLEKALSQGKSWSGFDPSMKVKKVSSDQLEIANKGERIIFQILASGDFNDDGLEDLMLFIATYAVGGTYHAYETAIVTRKEGERRFRIVKCQTKDSYCRPDID